MARLDNLELPSGAPGLDPATLDLLNQRFLLIAERLKQTSTTTAGAVLQATHTERIAQPAYAAEKQSVGTQFWESDRSAVYLVRQVNKAKVWQFEAGLYAATAALQPSDLSLYDAGFLFYATDDEVLYQWTGSAWRYLAGTMRRTWAGKPTPATGSLVGLMLYVTDRTVFYRWSGSAWVYQEGTMSGTQATLSGLGLGATDANFRFYVTDYDHVLVWGGAAWGWGPGEQSGYVQAFDIAPTGVGWQLSDGTVTSYLKSDGTTVAYGTRNLTGAGGGIGSYLKYGAAAAGPQAAIAPTINAHTTGVTVANASTGLTVNNANTGNTIPSLTGNDNGAGQVVQSGTGVTVAAHTHTHNEGPVSDPGHNHGVTDPTHSHGINDPTHTHTANVDGEPQHAVLMPYFRR